MRYDRRGKSVLRGHRVELRAAMASKMHVQGVGADVLQHGMDAETTACRRTIRVPAVWLDVMYCRIRMYEQLSAAI